MLSIMSAALLTLSQVVADPACSPRVETFVPSDKQADVIIAGTVANDVRLSAWRHAVVRVQSHIVGSYAPRFYLLNWYPSASCRRPGPDVKLGDAIVIYLHRDTVGLYPIGWLFAADAVRVDPRVAVKRAIGSSAPDF